MNKKIVPVIAVSVLISLIGVFLYFHYGRTLTDRMEHAVGRIVSACADVAYKPSCYDKEIPKFLGKFSMEEVFAITKKVQTRDASYSYCHVLGHAVSAYDYEVPQWCVFQRMCAWSVSRAIPYRCFNE
jgi:hypothetical protein